jgi:integrase
MLTDIQIKNAKPQDKDYPISDFGNLSIVIKTTGSKIWQHRFSIYPNGKRKEVIRRGGEYPSMSIKDARAWRDSNKELISQGITPSKKYEKLKQVATDKATFNDIFGNWLHTMKKIKGWSDDYATDTQQRANMYLLPKLGKLPIEDITIHIVRDLLMEIQDTGKLDTVDKVKGIVTRVLGHGVSRGVMEINVALSLSPDLFIKKKDKHYAHAKTPQELKEILLKLREVKSKQSVRTALTLLPHLLLRPKEVVELKWEYFDFNEKMIIIPAEAMKIKKKIHHVPLSNTTFLIFRNLKSMSLDSPYCFPSPTNRNKAIAPESLNKSMRSVGISKEQFTAHGNRHTAATIIGNHLPLIRSEVVDAQLHHTISGVSGIYNQADYLDERKIMMKDWSNYLDNLLTE